MGVGWWHGGVEEVGAGGGHHHWGPPHSPSASTPLTCDVILIELTRMSGKIKIAHDLLGRQLMAFHQEKNIVMLWRRGRKEVLSEGKRGPMEKGQEMHFPGLGDSQWSGMATDIGKNFLDYFFLVFGINWIPNVLRRKWKGDLLCATLAPKLVISLALRTMSPVASLPGPSEGIRGSASNNELTLGGTWI